MTTDGGGGLQDPYDLVALLEDHVEVVDHEAIADFALRHRRMVDLDSLELNLSV